MKTINLQETLEAKILEAMKYIYVLDDVNMVRTSDAKIIAERILDYVFESPTNEVDEPIMIEPEQIIDHNYTIDSFYIARAGSIEGYILQLKKVLKHKYPYRGNYLYPTADGAFGNAITGIGAFDEITRKATEEEITIYKNIQSKNKQHG